MPIASLQPAFLSWNISVKKHPSFPLWGSLDIFMAATPQAVSLLVHRSAMGASPFLPQDGSAISADVTCPRVMEIAA